MRKPRTVLLVMVAVKWDIERCAREIMTLSRRLQGLPFRPSMHSKRQVAYVVETDLTGSELMERLGETVHAGCIEKVWIFTPGPDIVVNEILDPLKDYVKAAWVNVRQWNKTKDVRHPKGWEGFKKRRVENPDGRATVEVRVHPRRVWKRPQDTH